MQYFLEIINCDPSIYTMVYPDLTVSNFMGNSIRTQRVLLKSHHFHAMQAYCLVFCLKLAFNLVILKSHVLKGKFPISKTL